MISSAQQQRPYPSSAHPGLRPKPRTSSVRTAPLTVKPISSSESAYTKHSLCLSLILSGVIKMKTVGDTLEAFTVTAAKPGFNQPEENGQSAFETITEHS